LLEASVAAVSGATRVRDIVHAFPWSVELFYRRGVSPMQANLTLAEVAAMNRFRVEAFVEALEEGARRRAEPRRAPGPRGT
jgi:hypothetical protein